MARISNPDYMWILFPIHPFAPQLRFPPPKRPRSLFDSTTYAISGWASLVTSRCSICARRRCTCGFANHVATELAARSICSTIRYCELGNVRYYIISGLVFGLIRAIWRIIIKTWPDSYPVQRLDHGHHRDRGQRAGAVRTLPQPVEARPRPSGALDVFAPLGRQWPHHGRLLGSHRRGRHHVPVRFISRDCRGSRHAVVKLEYL